MKHLYKKYLSGGTFLLIATIVVNICNFVFNAYLGRVLTFEQFGIITIINTMWYIVLIPVNALYVTVNHRTALLTNTDQTNEAMHFLRGTNKRNLIISLVISVCFLATIPFIDSFFQIHNYLISFLLTPMLTLGVVTAANKGFLQGIFNFRYVAIIILVEAFSKLVFAWMLVDAKMNSWVYFSLPISTLVAFILSFFFTSQQTNMKIKTISRYQFPKKFFSAAIITGISSIAFLSVDVMLAKHFLSPTDAGKYALLSLIGKMVYFFGTLPNLLMITFVSRDLSKNLNPNKTFYKLLSLSMLLTISAFIGVGPLGKIFIPLLLGRKTLAIVPFLPMYSAAIMLFTLASSFITFYLARQNYFFPFLAIGMSIVMCAGIIVFHRGINQIIHVIFYTSLLSLITIFFLHILERQQMLKLNKHFVS